jgi:hypothetical protein
VFNLAKSPVESLGTVSRGEESPVELREGSGDMGGAPSISVVWGRLTVCCNGDGEESWEEGGVRPPPPFLKACKSPVDRFMVKPRRGGETRLDMSSTDAD